MEKYKNKKIKISAPIYNEKVELPDGSYSLSDIEDCFKYMIKIMKYLLTTLE